VKKSKVNVYRLKEQLTNLLFAVLISAVGYPTEDAMRIYASSALLVSVLFLSPVASFAAEEQKSAPRDDGGHRFEELGRDFRAWIGRWWEYFGGTTAQEQQPVISLLLRNREKMGLSEDQVKKLEQLRSDFEKETIRNEADIRVAEIDLNNLLQAPSGDMPKIESKIREIERLRADLRIARIRAIDKGKALLSADQRKKLQELISDQRLTRFQFSGAR
jgi:Spy/CpxP family protein refolding chaperone